MEQIPYFIDHVENMDYGKIRRRAVWAIVSPAATDEQLCNIFCRLDKPHYDSFTIWFYRHQMDLEQGLPYTVALLERKKKGELVTLERCKT